MNILHTVEFYSPSTGGSQEVVRQLSERMVALGHTVTVATTRLPERASISLNGTINGVRIEEFDITGNAVRGVRGEVDRYKRFLLESKFDVVMNYAAQEWTADLFFDVMDAVAGKKVFVPCGYSGLYDPAYADYFRRLPVILRRYDATVYLSETYRDVQFAREHGIDNRHLIPNGSGADEFGDLTDDDAARFRREHGIEGLLVLTVGNHTNLKGHAETLATLRRARVRGATLMIVGKGPGGCDRLCRSRARLMNVFAPFTGKRVIVTELPRAEVVHAFHAADIFLFLSNIEASPIVLFEAAASGTPFVSSPAGNAAEIAEWTEAGLVTEARTTADGYSQPDVRSSALLLEQLAHDPDGRRAMGNAGRARWRERFTWERITQQYVDLYENLLKKGAAG